MHIPALIIFSDVETLIHMAVSWTVSRPRPLLRQDDDDICTYTFSNS